MIDILLGSWLWWRHAEKLEIFDLSLPCDHFQYKNIIIVIIISDVICCWPYCLFAFQEPTTTTTTKTWSESVFVFITCSHLLQGYHRGGLQLNKKQFSAQILLMLFFIFQPLLFPFFGGRLCFYSRLLVCCTQFPSCCCCFCFFCTRIRNQSSGSKEGWLGSLRLITLTFWNILFVLGKFRKFSA